MPECLCRGCLSGCYLHAFIALLSGGCVRLSGYVAEERDTCVGVCLSQCIGELWLRASNVGKISQTARFPLRTPLIERLLYNRPFKLSCVLTFLSPILTL
jgi:hypothetical protein